MSDQSPAPKNVLDFKTILKRSITVYQSAFKSLFVVGFIMACTNQLIVLYLQQFLQTSKEGSIQDIPLTLILVILFAGLFMMVLNAILFMQCAGAELRRSAKLTYLLEHIWQCFRPLLVATVLYVLLYAAGFSLLIVPAFLVMVFCYVYMPIILLDGAGGISAIQRSFYLVRPYFFYVLLFVGFSLMLQIGPGVIVQYLTASATTDPKSFGLEEAVMVFIGAVINPFLISICLQVYFALKRLSAGL